MNGQEPREVDPILSSAATYTCIEGVRSELIEDVEKQAYSDFKCRSIQLSTEKVGTKFFVLDGQWHGEIVNLPNGYKGLRVVETDKIWDLSGDNRCLVGYVWGESSTLPIKLDWGELHGGDPECNHEMECPPGGGIRCNHCGAWNCY